MNVVLDSGGVTALSMQRARVAALRKANLWPPLVPAPVLTEALTGDHRRDFDTNRMLRMCVIRPTDEPTARAAAALRTRTGRAGTISATDAIVAALAISTGRSAVLTSDPDDINALTVGTTVVAAAV